MDPPVSTDVKLASESIKEEKVIVNHKKNTSKPTGGKSNGNSGNKNNASPNKDKKPLTSKKPNNRGPQKSSDQKDFKETKKPNRDNIKAKIKTDVKPNNLASQDASKSESKKSKADIPNDREKNGVENSPIDSFKKKELKKSKSTTPTSGSSKNKNDNKKSKLQSTKAKGGDNKSKIKSQPNVRGSNGNKKPSINKDKSQTSKRGSDQKNVNNNAGNPKKEVMKPTRSQVLDSPVPVAENFQDPYLEKVNKLKELIKTTTDPKGQMNFTDMKEYLQYFTYNLFLEELFETDICPEIELEWEDDENCVLKGDTKVLFDYYVPPEMVHLKKHPFSADQPIFIIRKSEMGLDRKPEIWATFVSNRTIMQRGKGGKLRKKFTKNAVVKKDKQKSNIDLQAFEWNNLPLPIKENGKNFAILPGSNVMGRIMNAMNRLDNPFFINLLLGKEKIKKVNFVNKLNYVTKTLNDSQKDALQTSLNNRITILKGPPGSGKTSTIYEIIMQLLDQFHSYPILVVAASNLAVDNIAEKLMKDHKKDLLRITSVMKESEYPASHHLGDICLHHKVTNNLSERSRDIQRRMKFNRKSITSSEFNKYMDESMNMGTKLVNQARVILSTTVGIGGPYLKNIKKMPVIIMDEATQSSEPASLIPLGAPGCQRIIFVGDEAQLSAFTRVKPLEMSLFERVLRNGCYEQPNMLDTQYRMHPAISEFPRNQFYGGKLKDGVSAEQREMSKIKYPVFFFDHGGIGAQETREFGRTGEEFGFSWGNKKEVVYIERLIENLIVDKGIARQDIGIMTGYSAQRELITKALERNPIINPSGEKMKQTIDKEDLGKGKNLTTCIVNGIIVSTVDAFQGREKNVVLMSCVRSNPRGEVGFLRDYRRMNVAFTRAKYSFIMIGDSTTLKRGDPMWNDYINTLNEKGYVKSDLNDY